MVTDSPGQRFFMLIRNVNDSTEHRRLVAPINVSRALSVNGQAREKRMGTGHNHTKREDNQPKFGKKID
jgi:hypothetical protein